MCPTSNATANDSSKCLSAFTQTFFAVTCRTDALKQRYQQPSTSASAYPTQPSDFLKAFVGQIHATALGLRSHRSFSLVTFFAYKDLLFFKASPPMESLAKFSSPTYCCTYSALSWRCNTVGWGGRSQVAVLNPVTKSHFCRFRVISASTMPLRQKIGDDEKEVKLWGGRFQDSVTDCVEKFSESVSYDQRLYKHDIQGSRAHASMLAQQGLITEKDKEMILEGLDRIEKLIENGKFEWRADREDVHMNIEAALTDLIGEPAKKLHTARSRNDQVCTDVRLWCRDAVDELKKCIEHLQVSLVRLAVQNHDLIIPGYTHLQRAQPVLLSHLLLAYVEQLERDKGRLLDCRKRMNYSPLGACALAGTGLPIDRFATSKELGFAEPLKNSIDAVSDRDFLLEFLSANSIIAMHLSRLGEEWVLWASEEFGFITPSDKVSTGSSIMPQKKNPDPMELVRGKSARVIGDLTTLLVLCKGLPQAYNRDLQEDKEPLFDSVDTTMAMLNVTAEFAQNITFNRKRISKSLSAGHLDATTMADYLVKKGIPFRVSHDIVGKAVALSLAKGCELSQLSLKDLQQLNAVFEDDAYDFLGVENCIKKFSSYGSTGVDNVSEQLYSWCDKLKINRSAHI